MVPQRSSIAASRRMLFTSFLVIPCLVAGVMAGCSSDDDTGTTSPDGGADTSVVDTGAKEDVTAPVTDTGAPGDDDDAGDSGTLDAGIDAQAQLARGQYIVDDVATCSDCHTPHLADGTPDMANYLAGAKCFIDVNGSADGGCLNSKNLTNDATGLKNFTDDQIKTMITTGKRPDGKNLADVMPYYTLHNLSAADLDAVVAYLRTVAPVNNLIPANDPPFDNIQGVDNPLADTSIPTVTDAGTGSGDLANGRYMAAIACLECHTIHNQPGSADALDLTRIYAGGEDFPAAELGLPSPPFPADIYSANITQDQDSGIPDWTVADITAAIKSGAFKGGGHLCPPMPFGPTGSFKGLTDQDILDIATYIKGLPGVYNAVDGGNGSCTLP